MERHPKSTLKDIYKNFFQDRFGPGHLINDTVAVRNYLQKELDSYTNNQGNAVEAIGWQHNFYRVDLSVIKRSIVPLNLLLNAFVRSANETKPISIEQWKKEWTAIEKVIRNMNLPIADYEKDLEEITTKLSNGIYMGHHSKIFNDEYAPHYRIISKEIYETEMLPLLKEKI